MELFLETCGRRVVLLVQAASSLSIPRANRQVNSLEENQGTPPNVAGELPVTVVCSESSDSGYLLLQYITVVLGFGAGRCSSTIERRSSFGSSKNLEKVSGFFFAPLLEGCGCVVVVGSACFSADFEYFIGCRTRGEVVGFCFFDIARGEPLDRMLDEP